MKNYQFYEVDCLNNFVQEHYHMNHLRIRRGVETCYYISINIKHSQGELLVPPTKLADMNTAPWTKLALALMVSHYPLLP